VQLSISEEQKVALQDMLQHGTISDEVYYELSAEIDRRIEETYSDDWQPPPTTPTRQVLPEGLPDGEDS
jgi:hypothetical protein